MTAPTAELVAGAATLTALDRAYRAALATTSLAVLETMRAVWSTVDVGNLAGTSELWLQSAVEAILDGQRDAQATATAYTRQVRRLAVPDAPVWTPPPPAPPNREQVERSIIYTGLATTAREIARLERSAEPAEEATPAERESVKRTIEGRQRRLMEQGIIRAGGAATRHVTTAGMDQLKANVTNDKVALGWYRTTRPGCCYYCAMLASRGLVYKEDSFKASNALFKGPGEQKVHDTCGCGLRPVYREGDELPEQTEQFSELWAESTKGHSGDDAIRAFRRAYEGR